MPTGHLNHYIEHYLVQKPSRQLRELFLSTAMLDFAISAVMIFEPIYLYRFGFSIREILLFFIAVYCGYLLFLPLGAKVARSHGYEHAILFSSPFLIIYYLALFAVQYGRPFIAIAAIALILQKILYWPSYHATFASSGAVGETGRELSSRSALGALVAVIAPAVGGLVVFKFGYPLLFAAVAGLIVLSNLPLLATPESFEPRAFSYVGAVKRLFAASNRRKLLGFMGFGEDLIALAVWPIFILTVIRDPFQIGMIVSVSMLFALVAMLYIGRLCDDGRDGTMLRAGGIFTVIAWLARPFAYGPAAIFGADAFYRVARSLMGIPMMMRVYDAERNGVAIEGVVFFEMALAIGKIAAAAACYAVLAYLPDSFSAVFATAAVFTLLYGFLQKGLLRRHSS